LWEALEPLLFSEVRGRARPAPSAPPAPAPAAASGPVTPTRRTVLVEPQVKLVCDDYPGADPPLLFVHGAFCDHTIWRYQVAHFAASHRCATLDLRGHGASDKPRGSYLAATWAADLEQVCQTLDLHAPVLVAHSLGASAALHLAAYTTRPLSGLVLIEPAAIVDDREAQLFAEFSLGPETAPDFGPRFARRVQNLLGDELAPSLADPLRRVMMATPPHVAAGLDEAMFSFSTGPVAARVTVPTLVLLAVHRSEDAHFFQRYMRRADVRVMEDVTHFPMLVTPGRTNAAIGEFLQRLAA
jgi:pimeloyl-ACP methyl ester carboxylesterase